MRKSCTRANKEVSVRRAHCTLPGLKDVRGDIQRHWKKKKKKKMHHGKLTAWLEDRAVNVNPIKGYRIKVKTYD